MFTIGNLVSFTCPVESHFSIFKYTLKAQKSQHFSFFKMSQFYEPFSLNPALLRWNLNTSQTKEQKRRSDWCEIRTLMRRSDWCEIHTLNDLIGANNIPLSICWHRVFFSNSEMVDFSLIIHDFLSSIISFLMKFEGDEMVCFPRDWLVTAIF